MIRFFSFMISSKNFSPSAPLPALLQSPIKYPGDGKEERGVIQSEHQKAPLSILVYQVTGTERCSQPNRVAALSAAAWHSPCCTWIGSAQPRASPLLRWKDPTPLVFVRSQVSVYFDGKHLKC